MNRCLFLRIREEAERNSYAGLHAWHGKLIVGKDSVFTKHIQQCVKKY